MDSLYEKYCTSMQAWNECAAIYEKQIVSGHPDITAFENFEEDLLDRLLRYLVISQKRPIKLMDIGCGSGRLHIRYGAKTAAVRDIDKSDPFIHLKLSNPDFAFDEGITSGLKEVWGIDFSKNMLDLAKKKIKETGLDSNKSIPLNFEQGSAFELKPESKDVFPVAVCLVNSISVMQGPEGAQELFKSMRNAIESAGGIAIISCYQKEYIQTYGLGQYESTLDVSGQPWWMVPDTYASNSYIHKSRSYKRAYDPSPDLVVDVFDRQGNLIKKDFKLTRDPKRTANVVEAGHIRTYTDYTSQWYSYDLIDSWIKTYWKDNSHHIPTKKLDALRAEPSQLAVLDCGRNLDDILQRWDVL
jgi:SAM-dependent methyltransferase